MRLLYGPNIDATSTDLTTSDPRAFNAWGRDPKLDGQVDVKFDPLDLKMQQDFWLRYIGNSRSRLAKAFKGFLLPQGVYQENPKPFVENKISVAELQRLYDELPYDSSLTAEDRNTLTALKRFLANEFKSGISIGEIYEDRSEDAPSGESRM